MIVEEMYGFSALRFFRKKGFIWSKVTAFMFEVCGFLWVSRHYEFFRKKPIFPKLGFLFPVGEKRFSSFMGIPSAFCFAYSKILVFNP